MQSTPSLMVQPNDTILLLNQMSNAPFNCICNDTKEGQCPISLSWTIQNNGKHLSTEDSDDRMILNQRGITYSSTSPSAVISIPDTVENNDTMIFCGGISSGETFFSNIVKLTIVGKL